MWLRANIKTAAKARKAKSTGNTVIKILGDVTKDINESLLKATKKTVSTKKWEPLSKEVLDIVTHIQMAEKQRVDLLRRGKDQIETWTQRSGPS